MRLSGLTQRDDAVAVRLDGPDGTEELLARWVVGCDGANSTVRTICGIPFGGSTYERSFVLGDGVMDSPVPSGEAHYILDPRGVLVLVPLPDGQLRLFADATLVGDQDTAPTIEDLQRLADERAPYPVTVKELQWSTRFLVHMRQADTYRAGRCLLAGDAAHAHSPAGGQGLNTGIQDAANLAFRLALIERGAAADPLLAGYEAERSPVAHSVRQTAHQQTRLWTMRAPIARLLRDQLMGVLSRSGVLERRLVPAMAQADLDYRKSPSVGEHGGRRALGRGLPDAELVSAADGVRVPLRDLLSVPEHVLLVLPGTETGAIAGVAAEAAPLRDRLRVIVLSTPDVYADVSPDDFAGAQVYLTAAGYTPADSLNECRLVLVRPDGYVAGASTGLDAAELLAPLRPAPAPSAPRQA
jgi:3-(3-hydroxy-phenyl)propionate hydroxylase